MGYEPILRAVCTPALLLSSADLFAALHSRARRRFERSVAVAAARQRSTARSIKRATQITMGMQAAVAAAIASHASHASSSSSSSRSSSSRRSSGILEVDFTGMSAGASAADLDDDDEALASEKGVVLTPAESAAALEVAEATALCLWHVGCLLTHDCSRSTEVENRGRTVRPGDTFESFSAKLLQA